MRAITRARKLLVLLDETVTGAILRVMIRMAKAPRDPPDPDWTARPSRILLLRHDRIGDMITTTALIRAINEAQPNVAVDVLASPKNEEIIRRQKHRGEILIYDRTQPGSFRRLVKQLRPRKYDAVLDAFVLSKAVSTRRSLIMLASGATYRVGVSWLRQHFIYNLKLMPGQEVTPPAHHIDLLALFAKPFGVDPSTGDWRPLISLTQEEREFAGRSWPHSDDPSQLRFLVNISAGGDKARRWPSDRYVAAIQYLRSAWPKSSVVVIALKSDYEEASQIARDSGAVALAPALFESFALIESADLFLTPDTGLVHAASAFQTPSITLIRPGNESWVPYRTPSRNLFSAPAASEGEFPAWVDTIGLSRVTTAIDEMLAELRTAGHASRARTRDYQEIHRGEGPEA